MDKQCSQGAKGAHGTGLQGTPAPPKSTAAGASLHHASDTLEKLLLSMKRAHLGGASAVAATPGKAREPRLGSPARTFPVTQTGPPPPEAASISIPAALKAELHGHSAWSAIDTYRDKDQHRASEAVSVSHTPSQHAVNRDTLRALTEMERMRQQVQSSSMITAARGGAASDASSLKHSLKAAAAHWLPTADTLTQAAASTTRLGQSQGPKVPGAAHPQAPAHPAGVLGTSSVSLVDAAKLKQQLRELEAAVASAHAARGAATTTTACPGASRPYINQPGATVADASAVAVSGTPLHLHGSEVQSSLGEGRPPSRGRPSPWKSSYLQQPDSQGSGGGRQDGTWSCRHPAEDAELQMFASLLQGKGPALPSRQPGEEPRQQARTAWLEQPPAGNGVGGEGQRSSQAPRSDVGGAGASAGMGPGSAASKAEVGLLQAVQEQQQRRLLRDNARLKAQNKAYEEQVAALTAEMESLRSQAQPPQPQFPGGSGNGGSSSLSCPGCEAAADTAAELRNELLARRSDLADARTALQEARKKEGVLSQQLLQAREALAQEQQDSGAVAAGLESELRSIYTLVTKRPAGEQPDMAAAAEVVRQVMRAKLAALEEQEAELRRLQAELGSMRQGSGEREQDLAAALKEVQAKLDSSRRYADQQLHLLEERRRSEAQQHHHQVESLEAQLAAAEAAVQAASGKASQQQAYQHTLEQRLQAAQQEARAAADVRQDSAGLRKQVKPSHPTQLTPSLTPLPCAVPCVLQLALCRSKLEALDSVQAQLDTAQEEAADLARQLRQQERENESLRQQLAGNGSSKGAGAPDPSKDAQLHALYRDLQKTADKLEGALERKVVLETQLNSSHQRVDQLQAALAAAQQQLAASQEALARQHAETAKAVSAAQAAAQQLLSPASAGLAHITRRAMTNSAGTQTEGGGVASLGSSTEAAARHHHHHAGSPKVGQLAQQYNDGSLPSLQQENRGLREKVRQMEQRLGAWEGERVRELKAVAQARDLALQQQQQLHEQLAAGQQRHEAANSTAAVLAADVARLTSELEQAQVEVQKGQRSAEEAAAAAQRVLELSEQKAAVTAALQDLRQQLAAAQQEAAKKVPAEQVAELHASLKDVEEKLSIRTAEVADCRAAMAEYEVAIAELEQELRATQEHLQEALTERNRIQQAHDALGAQCSELSARLAVLDGPRGPSARAQQLDSALKAESQRSQALSEQLAQLRQDLEHTRAELAHKEGEAMRLDGTCNVGSAVTVSQPGPGASMILRDEVLRLRNGGF
ncbi:hypothetical protein QJQ45_028173 [Haematococcus lacustris]|nr:hypothetical protein QJQ45_028173 [Haematococcus lacustris]